MFLKLQFFFIFKNFNHTTIIYFICVSNLLGFKKTLVFKRKSKICATYSAASVYYSEDKMLLDGAFCLGA